MAVRGHPPAPLALDGEKEECWERPDSAGGGK